MITYYPRDMLAKLAPRDELKRLVTKDLTVNKSVLTRLSRQDFLSKKKTNEIAHRVINQYQARAEIEKAAGQTKAAAIETAQNENVLVVQRVENALVYEVAKDIKKVYRGVRYEWLPSDAVNPDPIHALNYGKVFVFGKGEMPGDRYGCQCGMRILVADTELDLG
jgi:hypothetical protein